jgi:hypothetical protein
LGALGLSLAARAFLPALLFFAACSESDRSFCDEHGHAKNGIDAANAVRGSDADFAFCGKWEGLGPSAGPDPHGLC